MRKLEKLPLVAPSLLAIKGDFLKSCRLVYDLGYELLHFDVMDGIFVPNVSFSEEEFEGLRKALPKALIDVHLMVKEPYEVALRYAAGGAYIVTVHLEAFEDPDVLCKTLEAIRGAGSLAGLSVKPNTPLADIEPYWGSFDLLLLMSVEPGRGGQAFLPSSLRRMEELREMRLEKALQTRVLLEIDGGINGETGPLAISSGADLLVAGSYLFSVSSPLEAGKRILG